MHQPLDPGRVPESQGSLSLAVASFTLGVLALCLSFLLIGGLLGLIGLTLGCIHLQRRSGPRPLAWWGVSLSILGTAASVAFGFVYYPALQRFQVAMESARGQQAQLKNWEGALAPDISVTSLAGKTFRLSDLKGKRVVLDFWATWCAPCVEEIPHYTQVFNETSREELVIVWISSESEEVLRPFVREHGINFPVASGGRLPFPYADVQSFPTTFFIDRKGVIQSIVTGYRNLEGLRAEALASDYTGEPKPAPHSLSWGIWSLPIDASQGQITGELRPVIQDASHSVFPTVSADGRILAFISDRSGNNDVWMKNLETGDESPVVQSAADEYRAIISPDGSKVAYARRRGRSIYVRGFHGGEDRKVCSGCSLLGWSPDGREIVSASGQPIGFSTIDVATGKEALLLRHPTRPVHLARFSPDGQWLAFKIVGPQLGSGLLFISPASYWTAAEEAEWIQITEGRFDSRTWWSPDGNLLYFLSRRDGFLCIWARRLDASTKQPLGPPFAVHHVHGSDGLLRSPTFGYGMTTDTLYFARR